MKKIFFKIFFLILLLFLLQISQGTSQSSVTIQAPNEWKYEKASFNYGILDPAISYNTFGAQILQVTSENLLRYNGNDLTTFTPSLATGYTVSPDGLNYTFTIRTGVTFWNNFPFNAYVMQYSIQRAILLNDPNSGIWIAQSVIREANKIHDITDVNLTQANEFLANMSVHANSPTSLSIYAQHPTTAFIPSLIFSSTDAVNPVIIAQNYPSSYTTNQSDDQFGMINLADMFPQLTSNEIISYLGLPQGWNVAKSGIVPGAGSLSPAFNPVLASSIVGTGPYTITSITANEFILTRNNNWWNIANFNANSPQTITFEYVPDEETRVFDLLNNNAVSADLMHSSYGNFSDFNTGFSFLRNIISFKTPSFNQYFVAFNINNTITNSTLLVQSNAGNGYNKSYIQSHNIEKYSWLNATGGVQLASFQNPFSSLLFRKAFVYAFDYDTYITKYLHGLGSRMEGVIPNNMFGHQSDLIMKGYIPSFNLSMAYDLFQQVNWKGEIKIPVSVGYSGFLEIARLLQKGIESINVGINITLLQVSGPVFQYNNYYGLVPIMFYGWAPDYADSYDFTYPILHTGAIFPRSMNYSNPQVDSFIEQASITTNSTEQLQILRNLEINASGDYSMIYVFQETGLTIWNRWVQGWEYPISGATNPLNAGPNFQYLGLQTYSYIDPNGPQTTTTGSGLNTTILVEPFSSSSSSTTSLIDFFISPDSIVTVLLTILIAVPVAIVILKRDEIANWYSYRRYGKPSTKKESTVKEFHISDEAFLTLEEIIDENKEN